MASKRYRTKPVEIEAVKFTNSVESFLEVRDFCGRFYKDEDTRPYTFRVLPCFAGRQGVPEGAMQDPGIFIAEDTDYVRYQVWDFLQATWVEVNDGDYIIRGGKNEFYPCDPETFAWKYEEVGFKIGGTVQASDMTVKLEGGVHIMSAEEIRKRWGLE